MAKKSGTSPPEPPPMLTRKVEDVRTVLAERLRLGTELLDRKVSHGGEMMVVVGECRKWSDYNVRLLEQLFTTEKIAREYEWSRPAPTMSFGEPTHTDEFNRVRECIASEVAFLDSLVNRNS